MNWGDNSESGAEGSDGGSKMDSAAISVGVVAGDAGCVKSAGDSNKSSGK